VLPWDLQDVIRTVGFLDIGVLMAITTVAAITGDAVGYWFGRRVGRRLYERPDSRFFKQSHLRTAEAFYRKHGGKAIVLARFMPIVRTLAPVVAGMSAMPYRRFATFNVAGGILWAAGVSLLGYLLGATIPDIDRYLLPIIALIVAVSVAPSVLHLVISHRRELLARLPGRSASVSGKHGEG
jgi:membrane-associated protein